MQRRLSVTDLLFLIYVISRRGRQLEHYDYSFDQLGADWTLSFEELTFLASKQERIRSDLAIMLKFYQLNGRFPTREDAIATNVIAYVCEQVEREEFDWQLPQKRTALRRQEEIKEYLKLKAFSKKHHSGELEKHLESCSQNSKLDRQKLESHIRQWCLVHQIECPSETYINRYFNTFSGKFEVAECSRIAASISELSQNLLLKSIEGTHADISLIDMRRDPGRVGLETFKQVLAQLKFIVSLDLPTGYISGLHSKWAADVTRKFTRQDPWELRRYSAKRQIGLYAVYLCSRQAEIIDSLIDVLIDAVHKIKTQADKRLRLELGKKLHQVYDTEKLLRAILEEALTRPNAKIKDVVFPIIDPVSAKAFLDKKKLRKNPTVETFEIMQRSWKLRYRSMLRDLLQTVEFHSNNMAYRPLRDALDWIHLNFDRRTKIIYGKDDIPIDGVVPDKYRQAVIRKDRSVDKHSYELCVIMALREQLKCREMWVSDSQKYRNPDMDLPKDFEEKREVHYDSLGLDMSPSHFVESVRQELEEQLIALNAELPRNKKVKVEWSDKPKFKLSKLKAQAEPQNLVKLKREIVETWPMTPMMDILKETALDTRLLECFKTISQYQNLDKSTLNNRLILALYGLGTNTGLRRISSATDQVTYRQLLHIRRRFIDSSSIKEANRVVANAILGIRDPKIWGDMGTACASDSKQFKVWDQNPMAEWHLRYGGRGVMIYWHVDRKSMCIYSRLKRVSSSEVASMIEGVLNHCTDMDVRRQYVDSHGQTEVAFAFSHLLGFDLAPRIKAISKQRLYVPDSGVGFGLKNLTPVLTRPINWHEIERQYNEMVKYASAMKTGTSDPETILRRFTRKSTTMHPTYKALAELGRAIKTIFVCRYLRFEKFRQEINEGLNVMENWNSATNFVHFGRGGEISSNRKEDQAIAVQALHLLQNCLVYVNTHMYQEILSKPEWEGKMTAEDLRGITPLIYAHVNPYGKFEVDLGKRLQFLNAQA